MVIGWILGFAALGSLGAVGAAAALLLVPASWRRRIVPSLVGYATGTLLAAALLGMIPTALASAAPRAVGAAVLGGIVGFFVLERLVIWRHCHEEGCEVHGTAAPLVLVGDAFHNFVDGVVIAGAFLTSIPLGVSVALAVIAHEVPQEIGELAVLLDSGYGRAKALALNALSATATLPGALLGYLLLERVQAAIPYILSVSAASFLYVALADLVPALHRHAGRGAAVRQVLLLAAGVATIAALRLAH